MGDVLRSGLGKLGNAMILVKHFMEAPEADDGVRMWIEPIELVPELRLWTKVDHCLTHLGPPVGLRRWFEDHPLEYDEFRRRYHEYLGRGPYKRVLYEFAIAARGMENVTLLHDECDPLHNSATALAEYLIELSSWKM